jgi:hypothetical protein
MHVKSTSQDEFPISLGIYRNKLHSKPSLDAPSAISSVILSRRVDNPPPTVGQSARHDLHHRAFAQKYIPRILYAGQSATYHQTVRSSLLTSTQNQVIFGTQSEHVLWMIRTQGADDPVYL